ESAERAERRAPEMWRSVFRGRYRGQPDIGRWSAGRRRALRHWARAPGKASQTLPVRRGGTERPATGCLASLPKGSRKPLAPPGAPSPSLEGTENGKGGPGAL